jgi:acetolactate synthase-1/2/3 large subunit
MSVTTPAKHSDQLVEWLVELGYTHCFFVAGGNIMHLLDSARTRLKCIPVVHEVAAGIAVEYFNQVSKTEKSFALVTAGPGLTNIVTAISGAWLEHRDLLVIGGQVKSEDLMSGNLRQRGIQEIDGVSIVKSICKVAEQIKSPISAERFKSLVSTGFSGRKGPVFLEVCLDTQGAAPISQPDKTQTIEETTYKPTDSQIDLLMSVIANAKRPAILIGAGVERGKARNLRTKIENLALPILTTWHGADRISSRSVNYCGRPETWGQRASNLILNQADALIVLGARLGFQETGFNWKEFAQNAYVAQVDIDAAELSKGHPKIDLPILGDANEIIEKIIDAPFAGNKDWLDYCLSIREALPLNDVNNETRPGFISPYAFYQDVSSFSSEDDIWVPASSGGANSVAIQALEQWGNQKVVCDNGLASMGYGLSGAIGAAFAEPDNKVWLIEGDGGFTQNMQELATVAVNNLNIKIFIFSNEGYGSIRTTQKNYFGGAYLGCDTNTGLGFPDWETLASAYKIPFILYTDRGFKDQQLVDHLESNGPIFVIVPIDPEQTYWPKITSQVTASGSMSSNPLHRMSPDLSPELSLKVGRYL